MSTTQAALRPFRITDLVESKRQGAKVTCETLFEIVQADFHHRSNPFRAHIFICHFSGTIDAQPYNFRKCYARGCPGNLCPQVSIAVQIANRYLQQDLQRLKTAGIEVTEKLFELSEMLLHFDRTPEPGVALRTLPDLLAAAAAGKQVAVEPSLTLMPAVEHFDRQEQAQTFLVGDFSATVDSERWLCERCFACFPTEGDQAERARAVTTADARLTDFYNQLDQAGVACPRRYFGNG